MDENKNVSIGKRIKNIRVSLGNNMEEFGKRLSPVATKGTVSKWENGKYIPNNDRLRQIAELGNVSMTYLLEGEKTWHDLDENERIKYTEKTVKSVSNLFSEREDSARQYLAKIDFESLNNGEVQYMALAFNVMEMFPEESVDYLTTIFNGLNMLYKTVNDDSKDIDSKKNMIEGRLHESMGELQGLFKKIEENLDKK